MWFILREVGVPNIPPINQVRNMKFGDLNVEDLIIKVYNIYCNTSYLHKYNMHIIVNFRIHFLP